MTRFGGGGTRGAGRDPRRRSRDPRAVFRMTVPDDPLRFRPVFEPEEERPARQAEGLRFVVAMLVTATVLILLTQWSHVVSFLSSMGDIGRPHATAEEKAIGLMAFAMLGVLVVALVAITRGSR